MKANIFLIAALSVLVMSCDSSDDNNNNNSSNSADLTSEIMGQGDWPIS